MPPKPYQVCGLGNAIVDLFVAVSDGEFAALGFERGTMRLVERPEQAEILERFQKGNPRLVSGGSVANSLIGFSQLGGKAAFIGCVGDDLFGQFYQNEFAELGIALGTEPLAGETTGTCVCVLTPDAERTMRTCLAVSSHLAAQHVSEELIADSDWLFVEGYVFANPDTGQGAIRRAVQFAKTHGTRVAITCSEAFVVQVYGEPFRVALAQADLLFCNAAEANALAGTTDAKAAFAALKEFVPNCVVTDGPHGAYVRWEGTECHAPAEACEPVDLTGAGDMFAAAFLYGVTHSVPVEQAAKAANHLCRKVITQVGARLHEGTRAAWDAALTGRA